MPPHAFYACLTVRCDTCSTAGREACICTSIAHTTHGNTRDSIGGPAYHWFVDRPTPPCYDGHAESPIADGVRAAPPSHFSGLQQLCIVLRPPSAQHTLQYTIRQGGVVYTAEKFFREEVARPSGEACCSHTVSSYCLCAVV